MNYNGPKKYESQFDFSEGLKERFPELVKKLINAKSCECEHCSDSCCECSCREKKED